MELTDNEKAWAEVVLNYHHEYTKPYGIFQYIYTLQEGQAIDYEELENLQGSLIAYFEDMDNTSSDKLVLRHIDLFSQITELAHALLFIKYQMLPDESISEAHKISIVKHHDYGSDNILMFRVKGIVVRLSDKTSRLINLLKNNREAQNESIKDTLLDMMNYSTYAIMLLKNAWIS
jgi:hypothetical protein